MLKLYCSRCRLLTDEDRLGVSLSVAGSVFSGRRSRRGFVTRLGVSPCASPGLVALTSGLVSFTQASVTTARKLCDDPAAWPSCSSVVGLGFSFGADLHRALRSRGPARRAGSYGLFNTTSRSAARPRYRVAVDRIATRVLALSRTELRPAGRASVHGFTGVLLPSCRIAAGRHRPRH